MGNKIINYYRVQWIEKINEEETENQSSLVKANSSFEAIRRIEAQHRVYTFLSIEKTDC